MKNHSGRYSRIIVRDGVHLRMKGFKGRDECVHKNAQRDERDVRVRAY